jgi:hypothetical protein
MQMMALAGKKKWQYSGFEDVGITAQKRAK